MTKFSHYSPMYLYCVWRPPVDKLRVNGCWSVLLFYCIFFNTNAYHALNYRSQSSYAPREIIGVTQYINQDVEDFYAVFASTLAYTRSFEPNPIADCLFDDDLRTPTLSALDITGSGIAGRDATKNWLADYFGLPRDFNSTIKFDPLISNCLVDLYWYFGCNNLIKGLYATIHAPIVYTKWDLNCFEAVNKSGVADQPPGYFNQIAMGDNIGVKRTDLLDNFTDFVFYSKVPDLGDLVHFKPLCVSKMVPKEDRSYKTKMGLADIQATIGWNYLLERWCHAGLGLHVIAPCGIGQHTDFIFSPVVGNNKHWEIGAQWWGHYTFYVSQNEQKQWMVYALANITHPLGNRQWRVFDLKCKKNSRWMLAQKMVDSVTPLQATAQPDTITPTDLVTPSAQFANIFTPVAQLTQRNVKVNCALQFDGVLMFSYLHQHKHFNIDFGYNFWYASAEKITPITCTNCLTQGLWALKGDSYVYGFTSDLNPNVPANIPVALSATESKATIHGGTNNFINVDVNRGGINDIHPTRNPGIDNPLFTVATINEKTTPVNDRTTSASGQQTYTSYNPMFITEDQIDYNCANKSGFSNGIFVHFSHLWQDSTCTTYTPYLGGGLALDFGSGQYAVSQWQIWLKGGLYFH